MRIACFALALLCAAACSSEIHLEEVCAVVGDKAIDCLGPDAGAPNILDDDIPANARMCLRFSTFPNLNSVRSLVSIMEDGGTPITLVPVAVRETACFQPASGAFSRNRNHQLRIGAGIGDALGTYTQEGYVVLFFVR